MSDPCTLVTLSPLWVPRTKFEDHGTAKVTERTNTGVVLVPFLSSPLQLRTVLGDRVLSSVTGPPTTRHRPEGTSTTVKTGRPRDEC